MSDPRSCRRRGRCSRSCGPGARELGFSQIGVAGIDLSSAEPRLAAWLDNGFHGEMDYMAAHGMKRARPAELVAGHAAA